MCKQLSEIYLPLYHSKDKRAKSDSQIVAIMSNVLKMNLRWRRYPKKRLVRLLKPSEDCKTMTFAHTIINLLQIYDYASPDLRAIMTSSYRGVRY